MTAAKPLTLPEPNIPLLRKAVEWAEAEASQPPAMGLWDQNWFATPTTCGTTHCIGGWAVLQAIPGAEIVHTDGLEIDGETADWWSAARQVLGLTNDESFELFAPSNDITRLRAVAERIAARAGDRL